MSVLAIDTCDVGGAGHEVISLLTLPKLRYSSFDSSTSDDWSEKNAPQLKLILDEMRYPSSPYSAYEVKIAKYIDCSKVGEEAPHRCSSFDTCSSISNTKNCYTGRARSLTPKRPKKLRLLSTKKPNSCRLTGASRIPDCGFPCYPPTPSTTQTINIGTPVWYTYKDQLESTRRRDERNIRDLSHCQQTETPDSSLVSPMSGLNIASLQTPNSGSSESTLTYIKCCSKRRRQRWERCSVEKKFCFTETLDRPRWFKEVSVVPETAALNTEGGYFIGTWQLPITNTLITIQNTGEVVSTDPKFSLSAKFLGSRTIQFEFSDGRVEEATLSQDGAQIKFLNGVTWTHVPVEMCSSSEHLSLPREEDGLDCCRTSNIYNNRSNTRDNDEGEFVDIPTGIDFRPNDIKQNKLDLDPLGLKGGDEEFSLQ